MEALSPHGTYGYSCGNPEIPFMVEETRSEIGSFTSCVRQQPQTTRSMHPIFSEVGFGSSAGDILTNAGGAEFGPSPFGRLAGLDAHFVCLGAPFHLSITYLHHLEQCYGCNHRYHKIFTTTVIKEGVVQKGSFLELRFANSADLSLPIAEEMAELVLRIIGEDLPAFVAGFNITCIGDDRCYSYLPLHAGNTPSNFAALHLLSHLAPNFKQYSYLDRGSDERQYCAPAIASIMRSRYLEYPEYHISLDDLSLVTPSGLQGGFDALSKAIAAIEFNPKPLVTVLCEPQLGKRGLYPTLSTKQSSHTVKAMMNLIAYSDGLRTLLEVAEIIGQLIWEIASIFRILNAEGLLCDATTN